MARTSCQIVRTACAGDCFPRGREGVYFLLPGWERGRGGVSPCSLKLRFDNRAGTSRSTVSRMLDEVHTAGVVEIVVHYLWKDREDSTGLPVFRPGFL